MKRLLYRVMAVLAACFASPWAAWHQRRIRRSGRQLNARELAMAQALGLKRPGGIFICEVERVPNPLFPVMKLARRCGVHWISNVAGITLGQGIYVTHESQPSPALIAHELVHVWQYQQVGSIWRFMVEYVYQCLLVGYHDAEWEIEARKVSAKLIS